MKTVNKKITLYTQAHKFSFEDKFTISTSTARCDSSETMMTIDLHEQDVTFDIPDFSDVDFTNLEVDQLKVMKSKILADSQVKANAIDEKIQNLLSLNFVENVDS